MTPGNNFHITIKPIGAVCNMKCSYCYFLSKFNILESHSKMDDETLENFIKSYISSQDSETIFFTWHGGEPTLLGIDFFKKAISLQKKHNPTGKFIENDLQTNGLLIDDEWCKFLKQNNFLVGLSVDGDFDSNSCRIDNNGNSTIDRVIKTSTLLRKHNIPFNTLTVVGDKNSKKPLETYRFLKDKIGSRHMQFIPLVEIKNYENTAPMSWKDEVDIEEFSIKSVNWGKFLLEIFNEWYTKDQGEVFVYLFENFLSMWMGKGAQMCYYEDKCSHAMALDRDGSLYACDHFCYPEYCYGNINSEPLKNLVSSEKRKSFAKLKSKLPKQCIECKWLERCNGECPKKRFAKGGINYLCEGYRLFFEGIDQRMKELSIKYSGNKY